MSKTTKTILAIDDDSWLLDAIEGRVADLKKDVDIDIKVLRATNHEEANKMLAQSEPKVDFIISDNRIEGQGYMGAEWIQWGENRQNGQMVPTLIHSNFWSEPPSLTEGPSLKIGSKIDLTENIEWVVQRLSQPEISAVQPQGIVADTQRQRG